MEGILRGSPQSCNEQELDPRFNQDRSVTSFIEEKPGEAFNMQDTLLVLGQEPLEEGLQTGNLGKTGSKSRDRSDQVSIQAKRGKTGTGRLANRKQIRLDNRQADRFAKRMAGRFSLVGSRRSGTAS